MTSTPARGAELVRGAPVRSPRAPFVTPALIILLVAGLALRFAIAFLFFPQSGFSSDLSSYAAWANTLAQYGPGGFYANAGFADYPPGYLLLLWPIGLIAQSRWARARRRRGPDQDPADPDRRRGRARALPAGQGVGPSARRRWAERAALAAAAIYLFNPVTWYDSALWGQTDAAGALVMLHRRRGADPRQRRRRDRARRDRGDGQAAVRRRPHPARRRRAPEAAPVQSGLRPDPPPAHRRPRSASGSSRTRVPSASGPHSSSRGWSSSRWRCPSGWARTST